MMNRILKRPMFRMGGSTSGITSGLDAPRKQFSEGSIKNQFEYNRLVENAEKLKPAAMSVFLEGAKNRGQFDTDENVNMMQSTGDIAVGGGTSLSFNDNIGAYFGNSQDLKIYHDGNHSYIDDQGQGNLRFRSGTVEITNLAGNKTSAIFSSGGGQTLNFNNNTKFVTTNTGAVVTGVLTATSFSGDGSSLSNLPAGAPVGGASTNTVFFENDKLVEVGYQITSTKNAMSAGPVSISAGIAVTVPSGCSWTIV